MKKVLIILLSIFLISGCTFTNNDAFAKVYTTYYPLEYATRYLYGEYASVSSIYPSEVDISNYTLTNKQKDNYSNGKLFVYSGLTDEVTLAVDFLNNNQDLNIIDATRGLNYTSDISELWLNPSNYLIIARNIANTLIDYENNIYNQENINDLYEKLKIDISELDVEYNTMSKNASHSDILIANDALLFLSKYNLNVLTLNQNNENYARSYNEAKKLSSTGDLKYIYTIKGQKLSDDINLFVNENNLEIIEIDPMYTLSEENRRSSEDYLTVMKTNIEKFKAELFK